MNLALIASIPPAIANGTTTALAGVGG